MKKLISVYAGLLALTAWTGHALAQPEYDQVEKGRYLAVVGDCTACHTTDASKPFAGGFRIDTPFGALLGANITPDMETGIGKWTFDDFQRAMSEGIGHGGKRLYGAMPFTAYTKMSREDNQALWAYLQTLQPINHPVESNQLPFPFNIRASLIGWNWINFDKGAFTADPKKSAEWNRGAYLVEGPGHCGTCHTPKNLLGGDKNANFLQGNNLGAWWAPDITNNQHTGIGKWSEEDLVAYLRTGVNRYDIASGPMAEEVEHSSQHWHDADLKAVAVYLKGAAASGSKAPEALKADDGRMVAGKAIYFDRCSACHNPAGTGEANLFPRLADNPLIRAPNATSLINVVLAGSRAGATDSRPTAPAMPSFAWNLDDAQVANVLTYIRNSWGNAAAPVNAADVKDMRNTLRP
ncbi:c-type cytochrome [Acerihabitans arboris]|uniref:C-type cytochrome n=1 Tax=Acerihabitans arboris TaxID=2691583 RepID=A0A845SGW8_9GAMM|nr:cytochrome c [Acerihabitans arboris]NDL62286.1 c-type cytochrome [Acerihabitans arboris]